MKQYPFPSSAKSLKIFRIAVSVFMLIHGIARIANGTVGGFGEFLNGFGIPLGFYVAWGITLFEIAGALLLMLGYLATIISLVFVIELTMGILMVHYANGWFVVGAGKGGMEYSVLLIVSFLLIAATKGGTKS